ncbi:MAG TPA: GGDEF domain-containing protein [Acidimicrobiales bacterium]|nr:GGDEF domain-containing protein [Acidimicrobiales bacterium]
MDISFILGLVAGIAIGVLGAAGFRSRTGTHSQPLTLDPLTGVADRRSGERRVSTLKPGDAVVMVDIDKFKAVNDSFGHAEGDVVLRAFAATLAQSVRSADLVARWGGDEFVVVIAGAGDAALSVTRRLHAAWAADPRRHSVTCSAGVAVYEGGDPSNTVAAADAAMFVAKRSGRDRVTAA